MTASYYYDPFGRRLWKEVNGVRTYYHYADEGLVAEMDSAGNVGKSYGYKPGSVWGTDPLFMKIGGNYYFYHNDHLGTPQKMTASNGAVVWSAKYESFGNATVEVETVVNNLRFPGQYYDGETGLHWNYWRYYDPGIGRYLRVDPIYFNGGINLYAYAYNNSICSYDSEGLWGVGIGAYIGFGGEIGVNVTKCCENDKLYRFVVLTTCGGVGIGFKGVPAPPKGISGGIGSFFSDPGCPRNRTYLRHDTSLVVRTTGVDLNITGGGPRVSADVSAGLTGGATTWKVCGDSVLSKKLIKPCCE